MVTQEQLDEFVAGCQEINDIHMKRSFPTLTRPIISAMVGKRYARLVRTTGEEQRHAYAFVDMTNGDVLKTASWKAPAKHARGNLYDDNKGLACMGPYGATIF